MDLMQIIVMLSALLCSLVAGLVLTFEILVMPGASTFHIALARRRLT